MWDCLNQKANLITRQHIERNHLFENMRMNKIRQRLTKDLRAVCIHFDHHQLIKAKDHRTLITKVLFLCQPPASGRSTRNNSFLPDDISAEEPSHPYHQKILWLKAKYHEKCQILLYWSPIQLQRQPQD